MYVLKHRNGMLLTREFRRDSNGEYREIIDRTLSKDKALKFSLPADALCFASMWCAFPNLWEPERTAEPEAVV